MASCATWWFDHVGETYIYVVGVKAGDARQKEEYSRKLDQGAEEWGRLLGMPTAGDLAAVHVSALKSLADSAFAGDKASVDQAVETLMENLRSQREFYAGSIAGFPAEQWEALFSLHIASTGAYILALAAGDVRDFRSNYDAVVKGRNELGLFWGRLTAGL